MRIFLDANIFVAAAGSLEGGSRYLFQIAQKEHWTLVTSFYALREARANIERKLPASVSVFSTLVTHPALMVTAEAPHQLQQLCAAVLPEKDVPILASALFARCAFLCTLDRRDFHLERVQSFCRRYKMAVVTPKDILVRYRRASHGG